MDPNERRDLVRDSGVHVPNSVEDNSFEDEEENPIDPCLNEPVLLTIPEEEAAGLPEVAEEEVEEENNNNGNPNTGQNMPPQVNPNPPNAVQPQQLNALLQFDGNRSQAFVNWIE